MRVWVPISIQQFTLFDLDRTVLVQSGFAVTPAWAANQEDQDLEVLEAQILELAGQTSPVVLVAEMPATELPGNGGQVAIPNAISERQVLAIFAASPQEPEEMLWFGPTERLEAKAFLGID